jgi:hypothetical protein
MYQMGTEIQFITKENQLKDNIHQSIGIFHPIRKNSISWETLVK